MTRHIAEEDNTTMNNATMNNATMNKATVTTKR
jgi:hypothetical protein